MQQLKSEKLIIPLIYLIEDEKELREIPMGIPFIRGNKEDYAKYVKLLEFQILLKSAQASGLPFLWEKVLQDNGYGNDYIKAFAQSSFVLTEKGESLGEYAQSSVVDYLVDISYQVDIEVLKELSIIPTWFSDIETAIKENILNSITYNPNLYNKKLDLVAGGIDLSTPDKNLIIIDISGSIPKSISEAILLLSKTMATQFYADLLITGSKSTLYDYTEMDKINVKKVYQENGTDNDQTHFKKLLIEHNKYNTVISFGDNHSPCMAWSNGYNHKNDHITKEEGKKLNKWEVKSIYSFHTTSESILTGYCDWFDVPEDKITYMKNWVKYLD